MPLAVDSTITIDSGVLGTEPKMPRISLVALAQKANSEQWNRETVAERPEPVLRAARMRAQLSLSQRIQPSASFTRLALRKPSVGS